MTPLGTFILVTGVSMVPTILPGQKEVLLNTPYSQLKVGDIVDYLNPATHVRTCHRIVRGYPGKWVAKGDANKYEDRGFVTPGDYIGEVRLIKY